MASQGVSSSTRATVHDEATVSQTFSFSAGATVHEKPWYVNGYLFLGDYLCGLVVRVPSFRSRGPGSIPGATRFSAAGFIQPEYK
jgi:hypothetical protein